MLHGPEIYILECFVAVVKVLYCFKKNSLILGSPILNYPEAKLYIINAIFMRVTSLNVSKIG